MVLVYVNDMLITCSSLDVIKETKEILKQTLKLKDLGDLKYFLDMVFAISKGGFLTHQRKYILEVISKTSLAAAKATVKPMEINVKLTSRQ